MKAIEAFVVLLGACGQACGGSWSDSDAKSATDAVHLEAIALSLCAPDGDACAPGQVRALERAALCANASMLYRHDVAFEAGVQCQP